MDSVAMAEELAWLIKDNLPCKHLVLSAEEAFVTFLDPQQTSSVLTLQPMAAYHRMLLHRLADIFRLAHESIGEGEDRRLVLERSEDSFIPDVLVSDILECSESIDFSIGPQSSPLLLKRNTDYSEVRQCTGAQNSQMSFEERQAAYLAARERIFSEDLGESASQSPIQRPRSVPVVARRMIAHALGKHILVEQDLKANAVSSASGVTRELDTTFDTTEPTELTVVEATGAAAVSLSSDEANLQAEASYLQAKAAKRMFAQALGLGSSKSSIRAPAPSRPEEKKTDCMQPNKSHPGIQGSSSAGAQDMSKDVRTIKASGDQLSQTGAMGTAQVEQGKAAQRMFAQALGFRSLSIVAQRSKRP